MSSESEYESEPGGSSDNGENDENSNQSGESSGEKDDDKAQNSTWEDLVSYFKLDPHCA